MHEFTRKEIDAMTPAELFQLMVESMKVLERHLPMLERAIQKYPKDSLN